MEEFKLNEITEEEHKPEDQPAEEEKTSQKEGRNIVLMIVIMLGVFLLFTGGFKAYNYFTGSSVSGSNVIDLDYLHQKNLEGKLDESRGYMYNDYSFVLFDGLWWTELINGDVLTKIPLHFGPHNLTEVPISGKLDGSFNEGDLVYVAIDPEFTDKYYTLALSELNFNIVKGIVRQPIAVCTKENEICEDREVLNCDETQGKPVIELKNSEETRVTFKGNCILIEGNEYGIVQAVDRVVLKWYGIMD